MTNENKGNDLFSNFSGGSSNLFGEAGSKDLFGGNSFPDPFAGMTPKNDPFAAATTSDPFAAATSVDPFAAAKSDDKKDKPTSSKTSAAKDSGDKKGKDKKDKPKPKKPEEEIVDEEWTWAYAGRQGNPPHSMKLDELREMLELDYPELSKERTSWHIEKERKLIVPAIKGSKNG